MWYTDDMAVIRPFRALRPDPARVALEHLVAEATTTSARVAVARSVDPRHLGWLLTATADEGPGASFAVADLVRSGILVRDALPSLTVVRLTRDGAEQTCLFAALRADADADVGAEVAPGAPPTVDVAAMPAIERFKDKKGRIVRAIEAELEREPDAAFTLNGSQVETWVLDDESAAARIASLLEGSTLRLDDGSTPAWAAYRGQPHPDPWALACFVDDDAETVGVPAGLCLLPLRGPLHLPQS